MIEKPLTVCSDSIRGVYSPDKPYFIGSKLAYFCRRSTRPRLVLGHFGAAKGADLGQDAGEADATERA